MNSETTDAIGPFLRQASEMGERNFSRLFFEYIREEIARDKAGTLRLIETLAGFFSPALTARLLVLYMRNGGAPEFFFEHRDRVLPSVTAPSVRRLLRRIALQTVLRVRKNRANADENSRRYFEEATAYVTDHPGDVGGDDLFRVIRGIREMHDISLFCKAEDFFALEAGFAEVLRKAYEGGAVFAGDDMVRPVLQLFLIGRGLLDVGEVAGRIALKELTEEQKDFFSPEILSLALSGDEAARKMVNGRFSHEIGGERFILVGELFRNSVQDIVQTLPRPKTAAPGQGPVPRVVYWIDAGVPHKAESADFVFSVFAKSLAGVCAAADLPVQIVLDCGAEVSLFDETKAFGVYRDIKARLGLDKVRFTYISQNFSNAISAEGRAAGDVDAEVVHFNTHFLKFSMPEKEFSAQLSNRFLCLNNIPKPHRLAILIHMQEAFGFEGVNYSFNHSLSNLPPNVPGKRLEAPALHKAFFEGAMEEDAFRKAYRRLARKLPKYLDLVDRDTLNMHGRGAHVNRADEDFFKESYIHLVTESDFDTGHNILRFTEKIFKPIATLSPFILIGQPGTLKAMRELGFRTFSDFWDESYDGITDPKARMQALFALTRDLSRLDNAEMERMRGEMEGLLSYNYETLRRFCDEGGCELFSKIGIGKN